MEIKLDSGREVRFNLEENRHLDYGYAVTSHSSQGATADRVLIHVDSEQAHEQAHQQPPGLCRRFPRPLRCADLHQRRRQAREGAQPRGIARGSGSGRRKEFRGWQRRTAQASNPPRTTARQWRWSNELAFFAGPLPAGWTRVYLRYRV